MPNRYVREDAIESERVNALSWQGEVFFRRLINRVDDFGRHSASLPLLRASIFPLQLDKVSEKDVKRLLDEAEACGLLATYQSDGKSYLALAKWEKARAIKSKYPEPPAEICERLQTFVYRSGQASTDAPDSDTDTDSDTDSDKEAAKALKERIGAWFNRRPTTEWSPKERKALRGVIKLKTSPDDLDALERYYRSGTQFLRRDVLTLLNNWQGEVDRAKREFGGRQTQLAINETPEEREKRILKEVWS